MSSSTIGFAILLGIANPIPSTSVAPIFTVLIPMTLPEDETSAPPLFPGFIAASVCKSLYVLPFEVSVLLSAETYPTVILPASSRPSGFPIATTNSPTFKLFESSKVAAESPSFCIFITAMSVTESAPIMLASISSSEFGSVTYTFEID